MLSDPHCRVAVQQQHHPAWPPLLLVKLHAWSYGMITRRPMDMTAASRLDVLLLITYYLPFSEVQKGFGVFIDHWSIKMVLDYER